jgi:hypothetical protein
MGFRRGCSRVAAGGGARWCQIQAVSRGGPAAGVKQGLGKNVDKPRGFWEGGAAGVAGGGGARVR